MSCIEYSQRLLNAGLLTKKELPAILSGDVSEQALRVFDRTHFLPAFLRMFSTAFVICSVV